MSVRHLREVRTSLAMVVRGVVRSESQFVGTLPRLPRETDLTIWSSLAMGLAVRSQLCALVGEPRRVGPIT
jgi:hypothetical protein